MASKLYYVADHDLATLPGIDLAVHLDHALRDHGLRFATARHEALEFENLEQFCRFLNDFYIAHDARTAPPFHRQRNLLCPIPLANIWGHKTHRRTCQRAFRSTHWSVYTMNTSLRSLSTLVLSSSLLLGLVACNKAEPTKEMSDPAAASEPAPASASASAPGVTLETLDQKVSYGIGRNIGGEISRDPNFTVDVEALVAGLRSGATNSESILNAEEMQAAFAEIRARAEASAGEVAEAAQAAVAGERAKAAEFLVTNGGREGVITTSTGLQYEVLTAATGAIPASTDTVQVHYHGTLTDGTVFDSSVERGSPIDFPVTGVISGWVEALQIMPVGSKWKIFVPPALGYGDRGSGAIPGGAALVFEVELLDIVTPPAPPSAGPAELEITETPETP